MQPTTKGCSLFIVYIVNHIKQKIKCFIKIFIVFYLIRQNFNVLKAILFVGQKNHKSYDTENFQNYTEIKTAISRKFYEILLKTDRHCSKYFLCCHGT